MHDYRHLAVAIREIGEGFRGRIIRPLIDHLNSASSQSPIGPRTQAVSIFARQPTYRNRPVVLIGQVFGAGTKNLWPRPGVALWHLIAGTRRPLADEPLGRST